MKWSDGHPFTADDFVFWFEDVLLEPGGGAHAAVVMSINGKPIAVKKVDAVTVQLVAPDPTTPGPRCWPRSGASATTHASGGTHWAASRRPTT